MFLPLRRATLLIESGPSDDPGRKHLFILLTDPAEDESGARSVLMVSISSVKQGIPYDPTCLLHPGDHPFVRQLSYVSYARARIEEADKLQRGVGAGKLTPREPVEAGIFARICKGLEESRQTAPRIRDFYVRALA